MFFTALSPREAGKLKVFFQDERHLLWGDVCGYAWGQTDQRISVSITNENQKQTYYDAIDLQTHQLSIQPYKKGESQFTIAFLKYLQAQYPESRIALIWDGAQRVRATEASLLLPSGVRALTQCRREPEGFYSAIDV